MLGGGVRDRQAEQEDDQAGRQDRPEGVDEAGVDQHRRADGFQHQEGGSTERRVGHAQR
ncbi:hypothetical protein SDC9_206910 [bioreactor metagenome]|uniref:Uncharacterized protein n=1 Tax=bioreactor metagenome TaxID=1076179 RepID=A0A645J7S0_9ZZZZ